MEQPEDPDHKKQKFLARIGAEGIRKYENIDKLFVPPGNYADVKKALEEDKVVFITGTKEYGKTYTAIRLLWDYFCKGYDPIWLKGQNEEQRSEILGRLLNVESHLKQHCIIYFEDPFGRTEYEAYEDQVTRNISTIIDTIKNAEDTYIVITSRDEVFKDFERRVIAGTDLEHFQKRLTLKANSFDGQKRAEMLLNWAKMLNCEWLKHEYLVNLVLDKIVSEDKLPTCLNIEQFSYATIDVDNEQKLLETIEAKSMETARSFAEEIKVMSQDKILFLSFLSISVFKLELVKDLYHELALELGLPLQFQEIKEWFEEDKVLVREGVVGFSHISFNEAWEYVLDNNGYPSTVSVEIFSKVLLHLLELDSLKKNAEKTIIEYIEYLPSFLVSKLIKDLGRPSARRSVFDSLLINKKFYDRNTIEILTMEDRFFLYCVINHRPDPKITIDKKFKWDKLFNSLRSAEKFRQNVSERLLLAIASSPELLKINTPYYAKMFENLIEFEIKKTVREKKFLAMEELSTKIKTDPSTITIREKFRFEEFDKVFHRVLLKLDDENFIFISQRYGLVRYARRLLQNTPFPKSQSGSETRVVEYINAITQYMETYRRYSIRTRALTSFQIVKNDPSLQGVEPLRKSAMLVFLAGQEFGVSNVRNFLYEATGVSNSYLSTLDNRKRYTDLIYKNQKHDSP